RSGCRILSFGLESLSPASVVSVDKTFNQPERYAEQLRHVRDHGIAVSTEMIVGLDGDTEATFEATYRFLMDNRVPLPRLYILTPVPGTGTWADMEAEGRIFDRDVAGYNGGRCVFHPRGMDAETLQRGYWRTYESLYTWRAIARRVQGIPPGME